MQSNSIARRDEGFSVAEVVIAAAIMFFVLTAMIGLVGASQDMTVAAKRRTIVTNATAEYIERLRAVDFTKLAMEPEGTVKAVEDVSYGGYTVRFSNRVVFPDGTGKKLRSVYVKATTTIGGRTFTQNAVVHIKNPSDDTAGATLVDPNRPITPSCMGDGCIRTTLGSTSRPM
jgi:Tfp pilus assembly protein PilV